METHISIQAIRVMADVRRERGGNMIWTNPHHREVDGDRREGFGLARRTLGLARISADACAYAYAYADAYTYADADADANPYPDANTYADTYADANPHADAGHRR